MRIGHNGREKLLYSRVIYQDHDLFYTFDSIYRGFNIVGRVEHHRLGRNFLSLQGRLIKFNDTIAYYSYGYLGASEQDKYFRDMLLALTNHVLILCRRKNAKGE